MSRDPFNPNHAWGAIACQKFPKWGYRILRIEKATSKKSKGHYTSVWGKQ
jgi:hypothetical protein